jgi:hypothetical protein
VKVDPNQHETIYSLVYGSTDRTRTANTFYKWRGINKGLPRRSLTALTINPKNPNILYVGTNTDGIFKSIDGGENWTPANNGIACGPPLMIW